MNRLFFSTFLIGLLLISCSSIPLESIATLTAVPPNTITPSPSATPRLSPTPTEMPIGKTRCEESEQATGRGFVTEGLVFTYFGNTNANDEPIGIALAYSGSNIEGRFFYTDQYKDKSDEMKVSGCLEKGRDFTLNIYGTDDTVSAVVHGQFPETDPRGAYQGDTLHGEVLIGMWEDHSATTSFEIYLRYNHANAGTLDHEYEMAGAKDDEIIDKAAQDLLSAVAKDDKESVARLMAYPIVAVLDGERKQITNKEEFVLNYEKIFTDEFKAILAQARPHHLDAKWEGIMLGYGDIWFNADGKVVVINN